MRESEIAALKQTVEKAFENCEAISVETQGEVRQAVEETLDLLDRGSLRVAAPRPGGEWYVDQWLKKAILLSFRLRATRLIEGGPGGTAWWDKMPSKFEGWGAVEFEAAGLRAVPGCIVRQSAYVAPGAVLMPSFVNMGAYIGPGTMVDSWVTVGSCAQIGANVHLGGGVCIGGVLEPPQAVPTIIEDGCFIGARSEVLEGCIVREGAVLGMGVFIGKSTKIIDRETGEVFRGEVPPHCVVVSGAMPGKPGPGGNATPALSCAVIVKRVDAQTRSKVSINELLRD